DRRRRRASPSPRRLRPPTTRLAAPRRAPKAAQGPRPSPASTRRGRAVIGRAPFASHGDDLTPPRYSFSFSTRS
ncbi:hypothetical protein, partial [Enterorhabdus sp. P55]|uniref:hypothetical protein n=1 Tax=Enterorhabdus sp. P55 TaxID=2304571 RepID=UPI001F1D6F2B